MNQSAGIGGHRQSVSSQDEMAAFSPLEDVARSRVFVVGIWLLFGGMLFQCLWVLAASLGLTQPEGPSWLALLAGLVGSLLCGWVLWIVTRRYLRSRRIQRGS